ncbi:unnamed protein product [Rhizophagus irregularis]|nr:unnamed protein product [Rhizophagus irregularis]
MGSTFGWALDIWISVHGFWIYGFRLSVGLWIYGFRLSVRLSVGLWDIWISFSSRALEIAFLTFGSWALDSISCDRWLTMVDNRCVNCEWVVGVNRQM